MADIREWRPEILSEIAELESQAAHQRLVIADTVQAEAARRAEWESVANLLATVAPKDGTSVSIDRKTEELRQAWRRASGHLVAARAALENILYRIADRHEALAHLDRALAAQASPLTLVPTEPVAGTPEVMAEPQLGEESAADRYRRLHPRERSAA